MSDAMNSRNYFGRDFAATIRTAIIDSFQVKGEECTICMVEFIEKDDCK